MTESLEAHAQGSVEVLFRLHSIEPVPAPPDGCTGTWYRYVIVQGSNVISGLRSGTLAELDPLLHQMVDRLNERVGKQRAKTRR